MVDEQPPTKKVVKRVVKKTVVRPGATPAEPRPVRYGRPVATTAAPRAKVAPKPTRKTGGTVTTTRPSRPRPTVGAAGKALTARGSSIASSIAGGVGSASRTTGTFAAERLRAARAWHIPPIAPRPAALVTGIIVGLVAVGLGLVALELFSEVRGVSTGGGRWGSLTFVVVAFVAFVVGELLLSAFGTSQPRLTSFLGVVLTIVAILAFFLGVADSGWALVLVPALGAMTYLASHVLLTIADGSPGQPE